MGDDHPPIFSSHEIEEEIAEHHPDIDNGQSENGFYDIIEDEKSAEDEGSILGKGEPDAAKDKKEKESKIGKLSDKGWYLRHRGIIAYPMNRCTADQGGTQRCCLRDEKKTLSRKALQVTHFRDTLEIEKPSFASQGGLMIIGIFKEKGILTFTPLMLFFVLSCSAFGADNEALIAKASQVLGPLPESMPSAENPITPEKVRLGKMLFYEPRISVDGTVSCAKCHPIALYAVDGLRKSVGHNCRENPRNDPTVFNAASQISAHWIGNRTSVEDQAKQAIIGPPSFGMPSYESAEKILRSYKEYRTLFQAAFPSDKEPVTIDNFAKAVGAFERTLITPAPLEGFLKGNKNAMTAQQKKGLEAFMGQGCAGCHSSPYVGGQMYQKFGLFEPYEKYTKSEKVDEGRYAVTKNESDKFVFKVPVLRNVAMTPPYFHDGSVDKLTEAVWIMGKIQLGKDLSKEQVQDIVSFLDALTGKIPEDARTVPLLPSNQ